MRVAGWMKLATYVVSLAMVSVVFGCAHYERNTGRGKIPGYYIRTEMMDADRAIEAARQAGKDQACPDQFKAAQDARDQAFDTYRACHTEEGAAQARKATAMANALCPPGEPKQAAAAPAAEPEAPLGPVPAAEPTPETMKYCVGLGIEFDIGKDEVRPEYKEEVGKVGNFMQKFPTTTAVIEGYTDEVGSDEYNLKLSQARAESVVHKLNTDFGIASDRLSAKGYGKSQPVADNATEAGRQKNRRINAVIDCALDARKIDIPPDRLCMSLRVEYPTGSAQIDPKYNDEIAKVGEFMQKYPTTTAVIEGHTDNVGALDYNMKLSHKRAENVVNYLVEKFGIDRSRLSAKGYGPTRRVAYNNTAEGRQHNRRINAIIDCVVKP